MQGAIEQQIAKLGEKPTLEKVFQFLRDNRVRPFVLDIETDSTIQPDEQAEKQARGEFTDTLAKLLAQFGPAVEQYPELLPVIMEIIKFNLAVFRAGRELESLIEEAGDQLRAKAGKPKDNPEAEKAKADAAAKQMEGQIKLQLAQQDHQARLYEVQVKADMEREKLQGDFALKQQENDAKLQQISAKMQQDAQKHAADMQKLFAELQGMREQLALKAQTAQLDAQIKTEAADQQSRHAEQNFIQSSAINAQKAQQQASRPQPSR